LRSTLSDPAANSIAFYQRFVLTHPFYDANGRIGRYLVSLYLAGHKKVVHWKVLEGDKKRRFLKYLNECHKRRGDRTLQTYERYLFNFWKKYVTPLPQEDSPAPRLRL
jgi:Fic family protein